MNALKIVEIAHTLTGFVLNAIRLLQFQKIWNSVPVHREPSLKMKNVINVQIIVTGVILLPDVICAKMVIQILGPSVFLKKHLKTILEEILLCLFRKFKEKLSVNSELVQYGSYL